MKFVTLKRCENDKSILVRQQSSPVYLILTTTSRIEKRDNFWTVSKEESPEGQQGHNLPDK